MPYLHFLKINIKHNVEAQSIQNAKFNDFQASPSKPVFDSWPKV